MNENETREDARHHEIMDHKDARYLKILEFEYWPITSTEKTNRGYIETLMSIDDGLRSISLYFEH